MEQIERSFKTLAQLKDQHIIEVLEYYNGDRMLSAKALGITSRTIYENMHRLGLFEKYRRLEYPVARRKPAVKNED